MRRRSLEILFISKWVNALIRGAFVPLIFCLGSVGVFAQQPQVRTRVRITTQDETGQPVAGVAVQIKLKNDILSTVISDEKGEAVAANFPPGVYEISVSKEGFQPRTQG